LTAAAILVVLSGIVKAEINGYEMNHPNMMGNQGQGAMDPWREGMAEGNHWVGKRDEHDWRNCGKRDEHDWRQNEKRDENDWRQCEKRDEHDWRQNEKRDEKDWRQCEKRDENDWRQCEKRDENDWRQCEKRDEDGRRDHCKEKRHDFGHKECQRHDEVCYYDHSPFFVVPHVSHSYAAESCQKHGGVLADIDDANFMEAVAAANKCSGHLSESWVSSWNGDCYRGACLVLSTGPVSGGGAINTPRDCCKPRNALCRKIHCEKKQHMPCQLPEKKQHMPKKKWDCDRDRKDYENRRLGGRDEWVLDSESRPPSTPQYKA